MTVSPAARRGSKLRQPWVRVLTTSEDPGVLSCLPLVMTSNFSLALPVQSLIAIGINSCLKSPAWGLMKRHFPLLVRMETLEKARVAVLSLWLASAAALG